MQGFQAIEGELQRRREQYEDNKGKDTPFRVEYRFRRGSKAWEYFLSYEDAIKAPPHKSCRYGPFGNAIIEYPTSQQIQIRGVCGGWAKYKATK